MSAFSKLRGKKILADDFNESHLSRKLFVDQDLEKQVKQKIERTLPILFLPTSVQSITDFIDGSNATKFLLIGTTISGSKASVLLNNPPIYCDIFCNKLVRDSSFDYCPGINFGENINISTISDKDFLHFAKQVNTHALSYAHKSREYICKSIYNIGDVDYNKHIGVRFWFSKKKDMNNFVNSTYPIKEFFVASNVTDPLNFAFITTQKYCGNWMTIYDYGYGSYDKNSIYNKVYTKARHNFSCNFKKFVRPPEDKPDILYGMSIEKLKTYQGRNLELTWDIETKEVKDDDDDDDIIGGIVNKRNKIFNICMTVTDTSQTDNVLLRIGIFRPKCEGYVRFQNDDFDIMCKNQKELLLAFAKIINYLQPDIMTTFNGNNFDVPLYLLQCRMEGIFEEVHCMASILSTKTTRYLKKDARGILVNNAGYSLWGDVHTTSTVSGIKSGKLKHLEPKKFKLEKDVNLEYHYWNIGVVHLDLLMISKKKYPKISCSLSNMLKENKIGIAKDDLQYSEIWRRWEQSGTLESLYDPKLVDMLSEIDQYCKMDCYCTYRLREKYMILEEKRSMCVYTHLPMETVLYQADGIKVESGLGALYSARNYVYVLNKFRGDVSDKPHLLDYHVEPPSLYNRGAIVEIWTAGKVCGNAIINGKEIKMALPNAPLDVQSLYPNLIINYGLSLDAIRITKPKNIDDYDEHYLPEMPDELLTKIPSRTIWVRKHFGDINKFAVVPKFLYTLFDDRLKLKKRLAQIGEQKDNLLAEIRANHPKQEFAKEHPELSGIDFDTKYEKYCREFAKQELLEMDATYQTLNAHQNTIKVLMNTVYGVTKFPCNIFYCFFIAHLVTKNGRELITYINKVISANEAIVDYNDTDSAYSHFGPERYMDIIQKYYGDKEISETNYRKKMTLRCMKMSISKSALEGHYKRKLSKLGIDFKSSDDPIAIEKRAKFDRYTSMEDIVNAAIREYTGHPYLRMVVEEILFPVAFFAKKKYFGFNHGIGFREEITINNLLVRGIAYVTRQTSQVEKDFNKGIMLKMVTDLDSDCEDALIKAAQDFYTTEHPIDKYLITFTNKPTSNNPRVRPFIQRMIITNANNPHLAHLYHIPGPLETFKYAIVRKDVTRTMRGTMKKFNKTDLAEYEEVIKHFGYEIDRDYYLLSLTSTVAQFLTYKQFPFKKEGMDIKQYKEAIKKKHLKPLFESIIKNNQANIHRELLDQRMVMVYKEHSRGLMDHILLKYENISDILVAIYKSNKKTAFKYIMDQAKKIGTTVPEGNIINPHLIKDYLNPTSEELYYAKYGRELRKPKIVLFLNSDELKELEKILNEYKPQLCDIETRLEQQVYNFLVNNRDQMNYCDFPDVLTPKEIALLEEFQENVIKYTRYMQYWNMHLNSKLMS